MYHHLLKYKFLVKSTSRPRLQYMRSLKTVPLTYSVYETFDTQDASPIFIVHGLFGSRNNWVSNGKKLARSTRRRVVAVDQRNHGESPHSPDHTYSHLAADIVELLKSFQREDSHLPSLIGHSMGGKTCMQASTENPDLVKDLVVVDILPESRPDASAGHVKIVEALQKVQFDDSQSLAQGRASASDQLSHSIRSKTLRQFLLTNLYKDASGTFQWKFNLEAIEANMESIFDRPQLTRSFNKPTLFLCGAESDYCTVGGLSEIPVWFPHAKIKHIPEAGHWLHAEKPEVFIEEVTSFLMGNK